MTELRERIAGERRRLRTVRQKLSAAVAQGAQGNDQWLPFYIAVGDYMEAAMGRLHAQDEKMGDMIREKVERMDESVTTALGELHDRLSGNQVRLDALLQARDGLQQKATQGLDAFEAAAKEFTDFIVANMGHHGATTDISAKLFSPADWEYMAGITPAEMAREVELFERVEAVTPDNLKLPAE